MLDLGDRPILTYKQVGSHQKACIGLVLEALTAVVDDSLTPLVTHHRIDSRDEPVHEIERQGPKVRIVAIVLKLVISVHEHKSCLLPERGWDGTRCAEI